MLSISYFWVAIAFVIFVVLAFRPASKALTGALDGRADRIRKELEEATRLREEAERTLADYQRRQRDALQEAEAIIAQARAEAERMRARATADLEQQMARREKQALDKISQAEATALAEVRDMTVDVAIAATRTILAKDLNGAAAGKLVDDAIGDLASKLH
jgi:F-type H+-transporting ATPase subunit b